MSLLFMVMAHVAAAGGGSSTACSSYDISFPVTSEGVAMADLDFSGGNVRS